MKRKEQVLGQILKSREEEDAKVRDEMEVQCEINRLKQDALQVIKKKRSTLKQKNLAI